MIKGDISKYIDFEKRDLLFVISIWPRECDAGKKVDYSGRLKQGVGMEFILSEILPYLILEPLHAKTIEKKTRRPRVSIHLFSA